MMQHDFMQAAENVYKVGSRPPRSASRAQVVEELPAQESPELFGMHPNADLTFRTLSVQAAVRLVLDTRPQGGGTGGGLSREDTVDHICEDLLHKARRSTRQQTRALSPPNLMHCGQSHA